VSTSGQPISLSFRYRVPAGAVLALLTAALATLAFPPYGLWPLIWVAFVPMLLSQYRVLPGHLSSLAPAIAIGSFFGGYLVPIFGGTGSYMLWLPLAIGLVVLLTDRRNRAFHERTRYRWFVWRGALSWAGIEMVRSLVPIMGTWAFLAYTLHAQTWYIQPVSIFGVFGLGLLIMVVNHAVAQWALAVFDRRWRLDTGLPSLEPRLVRRWLAGAGIAVLAWGALSLALFAAPAGSDTVTVAAVQVPGRAASGRGYEKDPERREALFGQLLDQTREAALKGAELIVWPEGALDFDPQAQRSEELRFLAADTGAYLVVGYMVTLPDGSWRNEATVVSPEGEFLGTFGKDHPVVFGGERHTSLGVYPVYDTPAGKLGTIICYDLDFTDTARKVTRNGAEIIAVPSLDWADIASKHYTHVVFRAVENRVAMVKCDGGYDSAIIDPRGRLVAWAVTPEGANVTLVAEVPLGTGRSPAVVLGDWVGWLSLAAMVGFVVLEATGKMPARPGNPLPPRKEPELPS